MMTVLHHAYATADFVIAPIIKYAPLMTIVPRLVHVTPVHVIAPNFKYATLMKIVPRLVHVTPVHVIAPVVKYAALMMSVPSRVHVTPVVSRNHRTHFVSSLYLTAVKDVLHVVKHVQMTSVRLMSNAVNWVWVLAMKYCVFLNLAAPIPLDCVAETCDETLLNVALILIFTFNDVTSVRPDKLLS